MTDKVNINALKDHAKRGWGDDCLVPKSVVEMICDELEAARATAEQRDSDHAKRYRWLSKRVVITDGSTPGLMVITVVDDGIETTNEFLDEFTEPALAAIESQRSGDGS